MSRRDNGMVGHSPRRILGIGLTTQTSEEEWVVRDGMSYRKEREVRRRSIQNTFKDVIVSSRSELEEWRRLTEFKARRRCFESREREAEAKDSDVQRVGWAMDGVGCVPDDVEKWNEQMPDAGAAAPG